MRMEYDPEADALFIELVDGTPVDSRDYEEDVTAMLDDAGAVLALEILDVSRRLRASFPLADHVNGAPPGWSRAS